MKPMAPIATKVSSASTVYELVNSAHISVETPADMTIRVPPIVGVPAFTRWVCGPSERTTWPMRERWRTRMVIGPSKNASPSDVTSAPAARNVMYWKTLNTLKTSAKSGHR